MLDDASFTPQEWAQLRGPLRLRTAAECDRQRAVTVAALLDNDRCAALLQQLTPVLNSPSPAITASLLAKRLAFLTTGACLYAMSVFDKGLRLSPDNSLIEYGHDDGVWTSSMPLRRIAPFTYAAGARPAWREEITHTLFAGLLAPLWQTFSNVSGVSARVLWENCAVRVYSLYERRIAALDDAAIRARGAEDFDWLLYHAGPSLFGLDYNPLGRFRQRATPLDDGLQHIRFRRTCCFYYRTCEPQAFCQTCPLLRPGKTR
ncbi:siderophore-iron reductase, Fe-S cluster protein [Affinibrenneria salicis]|uniref:Siderophore-iron reductase, Fe-S cluster protein n=1 Tax=Affinibrenneria salicis TaxID=2590031 RepID=A0A5J5G4B6_9GAMM|nr:IucA/IucC family C-terminal-domain containing protein [Affinibrenneria salicis]KAA9001888.1 siderophore-iron reductase, Fe-S cluster protein [Affinibrenneria salicis]